MATRPPLKNGFGFKKSDPAYLERMRRGIAATRPMVRAIRERYPRGVIADDRERAAKEQLETLEDETP